MSQPLDFIAEPKLEFAHAQRLESAKDGLYLFGPLQKPSGSLRLGVVGTEEGRRIFRTWLQSVAGFIPGKDSESPQHRPFPGFGAVFGCELPTTWQAELAVTDTEINDALLIADRHQALFRTVDLFGNRIAQFLSEEEPVVDVWFVVIPERVYLYGRPQSVVPKELQRVAPDLMTKKLARELQGEPSLFAEDNAASKPYLYDVDFRNQLKAKLLEGGTRAVVQVVRETALSPESFLGKGGMPIRRTQDPATVAWNLTTTTFFKAGYRPWRLANVRPRVCYIGLVFKLLPNSAVGNACCGAQMFLDSGDGVVFKSVVGAFRSQETKEFHLSRSAAQDLLAMVLSAYQEKEGCYPREVFIHGKAGFNEDEYQGFKDAAPSETEVVCVRIRYSRAIKLFRPGSHPVLRGTALRNTERSGFVFTSGYVPYLKTYPGRESPNPLRVDVQHGAADLLQVMTDVMALTKLNFNACLYGDGRPVTLRFADAVGEILTAGPELQRAPLPFKHYI